jgi:protein phosphatase
MATTTMTDTDPHMPKPTALERPEAGRPPLAVRSYGQTDPGRVRSHNEDQFLIADLTRALQVRQTSLRQPAVWYAAPRAHLFLVADGVGGHAAGERASALAVSTIEGFVLDTLHWCLKLRHPGEDPVLADFKQALVRADDRLFEEANRRPEFHGMATTLTMAFYLNGDLFLAHAGDSRAYLLSQGQFRRLTRDHTLVAEMVRRGILDEQQAATHGFRHVVVNVVGGHDHGVHVEVHKVGLQSGDRLLLCSDGLTEMVPEPEVGGLLQAEDDPAQCCRRLIDRANELGGRDNVTVIVSHFTSPD